MHNAPLCVYRHTNSRAGVRVGGTLVAGDAFCETPRVCNGMRAAVCDNHNGFDARYLLPNQSTLDVRNVFLYVECRLVFRVVCLQLSPRETSAADTENRNGAMLIRWSSAPVRFSLADAFFSKCTEQRYRISFGADVP